ncbi:MAG: ABC transporter substrate-binding protein [Spirochaetia bacterium]|nr:ABC transporter substrate-binding protein [Spirochaetia bacterium]
MLKMDVRKLSICMMILIFLTASSVFAGGGKEAAKPAAAPAAEKPGMVIEDVNLDALVKAAQAEGELVVYMTSSRVKEAAANFEKMYGIKVKGTKMKTGEQAERVIREVDAGNVQVDVVAPEDGPLLVTTLYPKGYLINWVPKDMVSVLSADDLYPLAHRWQPRIFAYNTETYPKGTPVKNVWELTEPKWKGKVILPDLAINPATRAFFAQLVLNPEILEKSYQDFYGKKLKMKEENAAWEFITRLFANDVLALGSDNDISVAIGAKGQKDPPVGMITFTKLNDNESKNLSLATCQGLQPFMGYALATYTSLVKNAPHPNAAKLFIRFLLTPEGIEPWLTDMGGYSPNPAGFVNPKNEGTWAEWKPKLIFVEDDKLMKLSQEVNDLWLLSRN